MNMQRGNGVVALVVLILGLALVIGWGANIVKLAGMMDGAITGWLILRAIGVLVPPLGAVLGAL